MRPEIPRMEMLQLVRNVILQWLRQHRAAGEKGRPARGGTERWSCKGWVQLVRRFGGWGQHRAAGALRREGSGGGIRVRVQKLHPKP
jgi:hypothetical protein